MRIRFRVALLCLFCSACGTPAPAPVPQASQTRPAVVDDAQRVAEAFEKRQGDIWVELEGTVEKVLADDREGDQHQRFIVRLSNSRTVLVSHNIDLASRVANLKQGDRVRFRGEYEWNPKGGVVHWTHHDPQGREGGWIEHEGRAYQ